MLQERRVRGGEAGIGAPGEGGRGRVRACPAYVDPVLQCSFRPLGSPCIHINAENFFQYATHGLKHHAY